MISDLNYWIEIGIERDIIDCSHSRPEYAPYVVTAYALKTPDNKIIEKTMQLLQQDLENQNKFQAAESEEKQSLIKRIKNWIN